MRYEWERIEKIGCKAQQWLHSDLFLHVQEEEKRLSAKDASNR